MKSRPAETAWRAARTLCLVITGSLLLMPMRATPAEAGAGKPISIAKIKRSSVVDFEREILPILKNNCIACHNQTKPKGGLVLETPLDIQKGGDAGPAVTPKKPANSLLLKAAAHQDPELIMPPPDNKVAATNLRPEELGLLQLWIEQGAKGEVRATVPVVWQHIPAGLKSIYALGLTRDGQFAACGRANQVFIYHLPTKRLVSRLTDRALDKTIGGPGAHRDVVNSLAFSPDGDLLASGGYREVKLWRRSTPASRFKLPAGTELVAASMDGKWLAAAMTNGELRVLNASGKVESSVASRGQPIANLDFMPRAGQLAVARGNTVELISVPGGRVIGSATAPGKITVLATTRSNQIAVACGDNVIRIFAPATNGMVLEVVKELQSPAPVVWVDASAAATNELIAGSPDGTVRVWDLGGERSIMEVQHGSPLTALAWQPDGKVFATAGGNSVRLWRMNQSNAVAELQGAGNARFLVEEDERELTFARSEVDYRTLALKNIETNRIAAVARHTKAAETNVSLAKIAGEKQTVLTNALLAQREAEHGMNDLGPDIQKLVDAVLVAERESTNAAALAKSAKDRPDKVKADKLAAEAEAKAKSLEEARAQLDKLPAESKAKPKQALEKLRAANKAVTDAEKEVRKSEQARSTSQNELELAANALKKVDADLAAAKTALTGAQATLKKAEVALEDARKSFKDSERPIRAIAFTPDTSTLVVADDASVQSWSAETGEALQRAASTPGTKSVAALNDMTIAVAGDDAVVWSLRQEWNFERVLGTGDTRSPLADRVNALCFTADGQQLFTGGGEPTRGGEIKLWRLRNGQLIRDFPNVHSDSVLALNLSPDGRFLASGAADRFAKVIDLESGKVSRTLEGHTHHVLGIAWKRDGRTIITAGADNVAKAWDATTGERRKNLDGFGKEVTAAAFVGVSDEVILAAGDGQVVRVKDKGDKVRSYTGASDYVYATAVTPDGALVLAGGADGVLRAWSGKDGKLVAEFPSP